MAALSDRETKNREIASSVISNIATRRPDLLAMRIGEGVGLAFAFQLSVWRNVSAWMHEEDQEPEPFFGKVWDSVRRNKQGRHKVIQELLDNATGEHLEKPTWRECVWHAEVVLSLGLA